MRSCLTCLLVAGLAGAAKADTTYGQPWALSWTGTDADGAVIRVEGTYTDPFVSNPNGSSVYDMDGAGRFVAGVDDQIVFDNASIDAIITSPGSTQFARWWSSEGNQWTWLRPPLDHNGDNRIGSLFFQSMGGASYGNLLLDVDGLNFRNLRPGTFDVSYGRLDYHRQHRTETFGDPIWRQSIEVAGPSRLTITAVPEPAGLAGLGLAGGFGLLTLRRRP